jgi:hypothetical protein
VVCWELQLSITCKIMIIEVHSDTRELMHQQCLFLPLNGNLVR